jgi:hypothetical protein
MQMRLEEMQGGIARMMRNLIRQLERQNEAAHLA